MTDKKRKIKVNIGILSIILTGAIVALVLIDLLTKIFEERNGWNFTVIRGFIEVVGGCRNPGCAFSFLADAEWGQPFLIAATFILLAALIFLFTVLPERFFLLKTAIAMIIAGALGNLIDRIAYGEVRDFVGLRMFGNIVYCNFADFWIVIGTVIAVVDLLFLNEIAVFPLTKRAKAAQNGENGQTDADAASETSEPPAAEDDTGSDNG